MGEVIHLRFEKRVCAACRGCGIDLVPADDGTLDVRDCPHCNGRAAVNYVRVHSKEPAHGR